MQLFRRIQLPLIVCLLATMVVAAGLDTAASAPAAPAQTPATTSAPASAPVLLATVCGEPITSERIDRIIADEVPKELSAEQLTQIRGKLLDQMILHALRREYIKTQKISVSPQEIAAEKDTLKKTAESAGMTVDQFMAKQSLTDDALIDDIKFKKILDEAVTKEKIDAFIKANPDYFNGTKVTAQHILLMASPAAATDKQKETLAKLEGIVKEIQAGKISFEDAAKKYSEDPGSKEEGGQLKEFTFEVMMPTFARAAFTAKLGDISPIVRTPYGFHVIKVNKRTAGAEAPSEKASETAQNALQHELVGKILEFGMNSCPIVIVTTK